MFSQRDSLLVTSCERKYEDTISSEKCTEETDPHKNKITSKKAEYEAFIYS